MNHLLYTTLAPNTSYTAPIDPGLHSPMAAIMGLSVDDIIAKFAMKTLPIISGKPDYASINTMVQFIYCNAASLRTTLGSGQHGHIRLIMTHLLYATLAPTTSYTAPINPGLLSPMAANLAVVTRETRKTAHEEARRIYDNHSNMDEELKAQLIDSVNDTYPCGVRNKYTGYLGITTQDLINNLLDRYGKITPTDIEEYKDRMNKPIDLSQPIDLIFQRIDNCVQYASGGQVAFTNGQILQTAYHAVSTLGHYTDACKDWHKRPLRDQMWELFKRFFAAKYHDLKKQQRVNHSGSNSTVPMLPSTLGRPSKISPWPPLRTVALSCA